MLALIDSPYAQTTDALYSLFYWFRVEVPSARYGGSYTKKPGFHGSVEDNLEHWPSNYSVRDAINRRPPTTVGRALDITLSTPLMKTHTARLRAAALADDPRLACVKEFYGTLNGTSVFGLTHLYPEADWSPSSADATHLWHIHLSIFTPYADNWEALRGVLSVLVGQSLADYLGENMERVIAQHGDSGAWVDFIQRYLIAAGARITRDGRYGDETAAGMRWWFVNIAKGNAADYDGRQVTGWILREWFLRSQAEVASRLIDEAIAKLPPTTAPTQAQVNTAVAAYLDARPQQVEIVLGTVTGTLGG